MNKYRELAELVFHRTPWDSAIDSIREGSGAEIADMFRSWVEVALLPRITYIDSIQDLIHVSSHISLTHSPFLDLDSSVGKSVMQLVKPTNAQWLFYGRKVGLPEQELLMLVGALSGATVLSIETLYGFDGNTVRKLGGRGLHRKAEVDCTVVEVWLSGSVEAIDEPVLKSAISELLAYSDLLLDVAEPSVRGSYYQKFKFFGLVVRYTERVLQSLSSAFRSNAMSYQIEAAKSLSEMIANHESAVIRVDHMIAIKVTRNGKVRLLITVLPLAVQAALQSDPNLIKKPEQLLRLIDSASAATPISRR